MSALALKAHAKINLYLRVGGRLASGYHQITSLMQSLALADTITISPADALVLECDNARLATDDNLVMRAARLLAARFAPQAGARIKLFKRIPVAAGLGGGSADAAATLIGLNEFWELGLSAGDLAALAPELGADVAFCLVGGTASVTGFGEKVEPLPPLDIGPILIIKPGPGLAAGAVYEEFDKVGASAAAAPADVIHAAKAGDNRRVIALLANDLEPAAIALLPEVAALKKLVLEAGASACQVSGSGPALFALADDRARLDAAAGAVAGSAQTWLTSGFERGCELITDQAEIEALIL